MRRSQRKQQTEDLKVEVQRSIRQMRQELGLSQKQLADKMNSNVVQATVSNWESGKTELTLSQLIDIMLICGKDLGSYFGFLSPSAKVKSESENQE
ncbi:MULTISPECIES: helix-turn-helix domain-containing protein [unclassified Pseudoalteromonas]|uniref:helix-turn-helix domain-containing protein n=1 Tax=unclassified Pseudoalteromonas TaxID=194690 RepID=UPI001F42C0D0|nr:MULTISPECIES: helix-turn-helix transcriptional regulator [unclassified Pseudoalteromonas]MCF2829723.1 helix-turn-helix transcriptional regulator [Pseudoalteromonas sp. OF5H-5]MCF2832593.1 helix-turn-helix transcriptional regulator [Pseudoalteromonas sp. DL2-H6]MCF2927613.1 helix-turn-helix transcriptional regulator [Pseudoalteromonas sp. DL2-H1]